ncbi:MAG: NAD(P)/FAD-dependent oxidoreductase [Oscillospiraceae bacterium]|jgi:2,4-dienoyl-CoA reductase-like NADH-dependent reductase (Old Yellow Enzyme family)/thioredoxin reductase|nr:NAD(P)/FAD-dependent oxidoreductase [Oscillospiraceae bacterium]
MVIKMGSRYTNVFAPLRIRGVDFKNRVFLAPATPVLSTPAGYVTRELVDWFRMFARGGACVLNLGNCSIDLTENNDQDYQLELGKDDCIYPLSLYADMCKQFGCHASLEINHGGEGVPYEMVGHAAYSSSSFISEDEIIRARMAGREPIPTIEMSKEKIKETVEKFGKAAARMKRAGMDIAMVHGGHGNLISQFTSPLFNKRTDEYGGSTENRARFAIEVCQSIRRHCGEDFVIEYRCSGDEEAPGSMHIDETIELAGHLKSHIDILHVSAGLHSSPFGPHLYYRNWCQNYMMDRCFNVHYARDIKKAHPDLLVSTVGSITSLDYAEEIISNGWADIVCMCRPLIADPEMPNKYAENRPEDRRPCLRCDSCAKHLMVPKPNYCAVNPMSAMTTEFRDGVIPKAEIRKKVAVIGGGPGGIQAMETLVARGHSVTLYEKTGSLGGNVIGAAVPSFKFDMKDYLAWLRHTAAQCAEKGARILLNTEATKDILDIENYDAAVIAVGADPIIPEDILGITKPHVIWAPKAEGDPASIGDKVVVVGGGGVGFEAALDCADHGKDVTLIEMQTEMDAKMNLRMSAGNAASELLTVFAERNIPVKYGAALAEVKDGSIAIRYAESGETAEIPCDTVLLAVGLKERWALVEQLRHSAPESNVHIVGDCRKVGTIAEAVNQAFQACVHI